MSSDLMFAEQIGGSHLGDNLLFGQAYAEEEKEIGREKEFNLIIWVTYLLQLQVNSDYPVLRGCNFFYNTIAYSKKCVVIIA